MLIHLLILCILVGINAAPMPMQSVQLYRKTNIKTGSTSRNLVAAVLPGDPLITGTLSQGVVTSVSLFSNVLLARFALSWFPQVLKQFPVLKPIITVTEPYLKIFRKRIPPVGGFDISAIPAIFILDLVGQATAALGAVFPADKEKFQQKLKSLQKRDEAIYEKPKQSSANAHNLSKFQS